MNLENVVKKKKTQKNSLTKLTDLTNTFSKPVLKRENTKKKLLKREDHLN